MSDFDLSLKKKKKSKKTEETGESTPAPESEGTPGADDELFSGLKKKKKKPSTKTFEMSPTPGTDDPEDLSSSLGDLTLKKKKKKKSATKDVNEFEQQLEEAGIEDTTTTPEVVGGEEQEGKGNSVGFAYEELLSRFFSILKTNNPELAGDRSGPKFRIPPPICQREGSKKTLFANVQEIATVLQRNPEHLIQFLFAELGTSGSIDGEKRLVLKGKFQPKQMESVLRRYIIEYVTCKTCKSMNTELKRESANRLHFLSCKACGSTRSVSSIKTGFQAQIGRRKKM
ncbi:Eukaryotic translation initiation factor 2 subunit beta [Spathaspora sp. JA1]|nr:Eukaryotic translation initiation factor 2 subunit beta [Spathaspora sp. JA1]